MTEIIAYLKLIGLTSLKALATVDRGDDGWVPSESDGRGDDRKCERDDSDKLLAK